jgi:hypothetical protein
MVGFEYLPKGLAALARAPRASTLAGHLGAAVVAGYFLGEDQHDLHPQVAAGIEKELDRIIRGEESVWFDPHKAGVTVPELFEVFPEERPREELIPTIAEALSGNIDKTRQSGHNVIFASIALRALHDHPVYATPSIVGGISKLIEGFRGAVPGRGYYGKERGWIVGDRVSLMPDDDFPPYESVQSMVDVVVDELIRSASLRRQGFGGLFHVINHAAGLIELAHFGYRNLARKGLAAHRNHVRLWRSLPDVEEELGPVKRAAHDPRTPEYWTTGTLKRDSARLTHRIKTLYGFFTLLDLVEDRARREKAEESFLYLMA